MPVIRSIKPPIRFWMTGAIAVVMAALGGSRVEASASRQMQAHPSRYSVAQTAQLIEATARRHGFAIFARVKQPARDGGEAGDTLVLVLESSRGGTPVLMEGEGAELRSDLPLRLEVHPQRGGASEVRIPAHPDALAMPDMPAGLAADLAELPMVVADALK